VLARVHTHVSLKIDDYLAFLSFLILTVVTSLYSVMIPRYLEVHDILAANANVTKLMQDPELGGQVSTMLRFSFATFILFWLVVWSVKFSMLFFFRRFLSSIPAYMDGYATCRIRLNSR